LSEEELNAAWTAALESNGRPLNSSRVNVVGQGRVGKTAFVRALTNQIFVDTESTMGVSQSLLEVDKVALDAHGDTAWSTVTDGSTAMSAQEALARRAAELCALKLSVNVSVPAASTSIVEMLSGETYEQRQHRAAEEEGAQEITAHTCNDMKKMNTAGSGAETEFVVKKVAAKEAVAKKMDMELVRSKVGKAEALRLSLWDFGGQDKFYVLHHLYLNRYCVYVVMFNMEWLLPGAPEYDECLAYLYFWLCSIWMHAVDLKDGTLAPILLVGSHKDKVWRPEDHEAISKLLDDRFQYHSVWSQVMRFKEAQVKAARGTLWFFPVDNTIGHKDPVIVKVQQGILERVGNEKYVKLEVPFTWLSALEVLQKETASCLHIDRVLEICAESSMGGLQIALRDEVGMMLNFFNEMGLLMYHNSKGLSHLVVLNPAKFLVEPASCVICQHDIHENEALLAARTEQPGMYKLLRRGILERGILDVLWREYADSQKELELLLTLYQLIVPIVDEEGGHRFLVPALLPGKPAIDADNETPARLVAYFVFGPADMMKNLRSKSQGYVSVEDIKREGFLPIGLFPSMLGKIVEECQCVHGMSINDMQMTIGCISAAFGRHTFTLQEVRESNVMQLIIRVDTPLLVVERMLALMQVAVAKMMPSLHFVLAVDQDGGICKDGLVPKFKGHLVLLGGAGGLEERLMASPPADIKVAPGKLVSAINARKIFGAWLTPRGLIDYYHIFLSYRWNDFDTELVKAMFANFYVSVISGGRQVQVFLDRHRLEDGRIFATDFSKALINSLGAVPIVSHAALDRMFALKEDSNIDNVLLEWTFIVELFASGHLKFCLPIMIGKVNEKAQDGNFISDLFADKSVDQLPDIVCTKVADRVEELLRANQLTPSASLHTYTVRGVVQKITGALGISAWDVNDAAGASSSHGDASTSSLHSQAQWKQSLIKWAVVKTLECVEEADRKQLALSDDTPANRARHAAPALAVGGLDLQEENTQSSLLPSREVRQEKSRVEARATEEARFGGDIQLVQMQAQMELQSKEAQLQAQAKEAELQRVRYAQSDRATEKRRERAGGQSE
jgi:GTPase SAR1 family protein